VTVWRPLAGGMQALAGPDAGVLLKDPLVEEWTANEGVDPQERADEIRRLTVRSTRGSLQLLQCTSLSGSAPAVICYDLAL